ncbi:MAG: hypothetical protein RBR79_03380 [Bacteroidales bacterium]|jgi:chromosome segregation ATPase|nr:hypothetical protein [Bacteroidales bacterium]
MANDLKTLVSSIEHKLRILLNKKSELESKLQSLENELYETKLTIERQKEKIKHLEEQVKIYKIGESINSNNSDITEVKLKINDLVRKIDRCVGMITKKEQHNKD